MTVANTDVNRRLDASQANELALADAAVRLKCALLAEGVRIDARSVPTAHSINLTRRHLYDYGVAQPQYEIPYELVLARLRSFHELPVIARVRYNPDARWRLVLDGDSEFLHNSETDETHAVEVPRISDFRGHDLDGRDLATVVQRLGYDLLGLVPTNYCSYYDRGGKCAFCEIVETHRDESPKGTPYRKSIKLLLDATEMAAELDPTITSVTYNGGQLADHNETVRMYSRLIRGIREREQTKNLNATIACMPPDDFGLLDELQAAGLNQLFINVETLRVGLLPHLAPAKNRIGLDTMVAAMKHALVTFGAGRVYSNLVYGVQSLAATAEPSFWSSVTENAMTLEGVHQLIDEGIVPTFTVYHSSGRNSTGRIPLSGKGLYDFTASYGEAVWTSGLIERSREAVLFTIGSLPNTTYNDGWLLSELKRRCTT